MQLLGRRSQLPLFSLSTEIVEEASRSGSSNYYDFFLFFLQVLHGPSMFAVKAKIYDLLYNPASSIDFDETSSYWSAPKSF